MCCLALTAGFVGPRIALFLWWIFGDRVDLSPIGAQALNGLGAV